MIVAERTQTIIENSLLPVTIPTRSPQNVDEDDAGGDGRTTNSPVLMLVKKVVGTVFS